MDFIAFSAASSLIRLIIYNTFVVIGQKVFIEFVGADVIGHWRAFFPDNKDRKQMLHALTYEQVKDHLIYENE